VSRELSPERRRLYDELSGEVRANQRATDVVDELIAQLLGVNRTDARCLDILDERGSLSAGDLAEASRLTTGAITAVIVRLERTPKADETAMELMVEPMIALWQPLGDRYSDDELRLILDFTRRGREIQEHHADWLRERLKGQSERTSAP
jgi:hypothetical protein